MNGPKTRVSLPRQFHLEEWEGMARLVVELPLSLYGYPAAGLRWEGKMDTII